MSNISVPVRAWRDINCRQNCKSSYDKNIGEKNVPASQYSLYWHGYHEKRAKEHGEKQQPSPLVAPLKPRQHHR